MVKEQEGEDLVSLFGHGDPPRTLRAQRFWTELVGTKEEDMDVRELEGYDEVIQRAVSTLSPKQRLAGLSPEQRLAGLTPEEQLLAMPDAALRALSDDYLATLPEHVRAQIRQRIER